MRRTVDLTVQRFGGVDILVNNAGWFDPLPMAQTSAEALPRHLSINALGVMLGMQSVIAPMRDRHGGSVVNICSTSAYKGSPGQFAYMASKWAARGMTRAAAIELGVWAAEGTCRAKWQIQGSLTPWAPRNNRSCAILRGRILDGHFPILLPPRLLGPDRIRFNGIFPGLIDTPMVAGIQGKQREDILAKVPLGRIGHLDDVAGAALSLSSPLSAWVSGGVGRLRCVCDLITKG